MMIFTDVNGADWMLDTTDLSDDEQTLLQNEDHIRLIGEISSVDGTVFHSCGAFRWLLDKPESREDFQAARKSFEMKIRGYEEQAERITHQLDADNQDENIQKAESPCKHIAPVRRMGKGMMGN
jgi:hypothetical protein